ncbi:MAG: ASCH domain-containing protein [Chloroflexi bacterium]|nr:ASCH domain-containing protein [Chloroflexota bacterium]MYF79459.1 ASCH domain-containing protein [Chloroflexota bacterium]MYK61160.1 ASCH domain-containing protein [Chloroflexota bacterium]
MALSNGAAEFLVLSVKPKFAEAIVDGRKTIEIRRQKPNVKPGTLGFVYSSSPTQAVVGSFRVDRVFSTTPEELWVEAEAHAEISKRDFDDYFAGVGIGHGIIVSCGKRFQKPIKLSQLRLVWPGWKPPRSFGYLVATDAYSLRLMSAFRHRMINDGQQTGMSIDVRDESDSLRDQRGAFHLKSHELKALISLLS